MSPEEFKRLYIQEWKPDVRFTALLERVEQYRVQAPESTPLQESIKYARELSKWCKERGYTNTEINNAKRSLRI